MPAHKLVDVPKAPQPPGPFSHATVVGPWVYVSGMGGLDPKTGQVVSDDVIEQSRQTEVMTVRAVYRNPIDSHGTATTIASATASAARYGHIRHNASSGETRPIAQAP